MRASQLPTARRARPADAAQSRTRDTVPVSTAATKGTPDTPTIPAGVTARTRSSTAPAELILGRYRLYRRLGAGAFGVVWTAHDERLDREVAVKIVPRERIVGGRFEREARAAARLAHPGIVTLYEAAVDDDGAYLVSELVRGDTLQTLLTQGRLSDRDIVAIAISLCDALTHAHAHGVVHRDVKPSNVLVPDHPTSPAHPAKLTDFGVARVLGGDSLTRTGDVVGTAAYMAPEQAEGREAQAPADLYALALVVYEALTGINPVRTNTAVTRGRRLGTYLPAVRRQRRDLPRELGRGVDLALRPRPRERGTLSELRLSLAASLDVVDDAPGVVVGAWSGAAAPPLEPVAGRGPARPLQPIFGRGPTPLLEPAAATGPAPPLEQAPITHPLDRPPHPRWPARAASAGTAALVTGWVAGHALGFASPAPAGAALLAAMLVLVLPRVGWLAMTAALASGAVIQGRPGAALVVAPALLVPVLLLPRNGHFWGLSVLAPALGLLALAGAWPALAGLVSRGAWRRAALGITGWVWLGLTSPLVGRDLYARRPPGLPPSALWTTSPSVAVHDVLVPIVGSGMLAAALAWGAAAAVLPWLLRHRSLGWDCALVVIWAVVTVTVTHAMIAADHGSGGSISTPKAILGALAGGIIAVAPTRIAARRRRAHAHGP